MASSPPLWIGFIGLMGRKNHAVTRVARTAVPAALAAAAIAASGCSSEVSPQSANLINGKQQFVAKCGSCHTLSRAGTKGLTGPDLDDAFAVARSEGWGDDAIEGVVHAQILNPGIGLGMPAKIVEGEDAKDVAAYVAASAAVPGKEGGLLASAVKDAGGPQANTAAGKLFDTNCGSCHTLKVVGSAGQVGPNLDQRPPDAALVTDRVTNGLNAMPSFKDQLTPAEITTLADFVAAQAGK